MKATRELCRHGHSLANSYVYPDGRRDCKRCRLLSQKRYHQSPKGKAKIKRRDKSPRWVAYRKAWRSKPENRVKAFEYIISRKYGLSLSSYEKLWDRQLGLCAICLRSLVRGVSTHIDHRGRTIRGLLCNGCNRALGYFREDVEIFNRAIEYIARNR